MTEERGLRVGVVAELHRYPLKSARGESVAEVAVGPSGLDQDRRWAVVDSGGVVSAKAAPELRTVLASSVDGSLVVGPDAADPLETLATVLGRPVDLHDAGTGTAAASHQQVAAVHVVSLGAATAVDAPTGCDPDPRANVVLDLERPGAERGWLGREVALGEVRLRVTRTPSSCFGVYADVLVPGTVRVGDAVVLVAAAEGLDPAGTGSGTARARG